MFGIDFTGIGVVLITMLLNAILTTDVGKVCKISADKTVALCDAEDIFFGRVGTVDLDLAAGGIEYKGFVEVTYSGAAPTPGWLELVADGAGGVKAPAVAGTGRMYDVVSVDAGDTTLVLNL